MSKKKDCPAQLYLKEVSVYPEYALPSKFNLASDRKRREMKQNKLSLLTKALKEGNVTSFKAVGGQKSKSGFFPVWT